VASVTIDLVLGLTIAFYATRTGSRVARTADGMAMLPLAIPGIILAFGYVTFYDTVNRTVAGVPVLQDIAYAVHPVHFPVLLLVMSYAIRRLPFMVRAVHAGFQQVPAQYEEASLSLGVGPGRTLRRVTLPLIAANVIAGAILCFSFAMLEVSDSLILAAKSQFYPLTKAIYATFQWLAVGEHVASALGVVGMFILSGSLLLAALFMGRRLGEMFRIT
jgi:iron(III) transport system permease protein